MISDLGGRNKSRDEDGAVTSSLSLSPVSSSPGHGSGRERSPPSSPVFGFHFHPFLILVLEKKTKKMAKRAGKPNPGAAKIPGNPPRMSPRTKIPGIRPGNDLGKVRDVTTDLLLQLLLLLLHVHQLRLGLPVHLLRFPLGGSAGTAPGWTRGRVRGKGLGFGIWDSG